jgi:CheY-like chemotaxis protein
MDVVSLQARDLVADALGMASDKPFRILVLDHPDDESETFVSSLTEKHPELRVLYLATFREEFDHETDTVQVVNIPLKRQDLIDTIRRLLGLAIESQPNEVEPVCALASDGLRILLAEDNPVNLGIVTEILESEGHQVTGAGNGREVLEALAKCEYDIVFMDVHMPVLDGLETTAMIRADERETGKHQLIAAMTADVLKDDRDKCINAGMDDFITKPLKIDDIRRLIARIFNMTPGKEPSPLEEVPSTAINMEYVVKTLGDNRRIILKTFDLILNRFPLAIDEIRKAIAAGDAPAIHRSAHGMKGFLNYFDLPDLLNNVLEMEKAGKNGDVHRARQLFIELEPFTTQFLKSLKVQTDSMQS